MDLTSRLRLVHPAAMAGSPPIAIYLVPIVMKRILLFAFPVAALSLGFLLAQQASAPRSTADLFREITLRNIPGTFTSGRIADIAVDPKNRNIWYIATAAGGLWKTVNHGLVFTPIFDEGGSYSLGCVTIDPKNSDVIWLGTGENQAQRAIGWGDGIYKSTDAGKTWKNVGLPHSEHVGKKILVDSPRFQCRLLCGVPGQVHAMFNAGGRSRSVQNHRRRRRPGNRFYKLPRTQASPMSRWTLAQSRCDVRGCLSAALGGNTSVVAWRAVRTRAFSRPPMAARAGRN